MIQFTVDHCRIGSLEITLDGCADAALDHCRIGSLEKGMLRMRKKVDDHCRIGSLENPNRPEIIF